MSSHIQRTPHSAVTQHPEGQQCSKDSHKCWGQPWRSSKPCKIPAARTRQLLLLTGAAAAAARAPVAGAVVALGRGLLLLSRLAWWAR